MFKCAGPYINLKYISESRNFYLKDIKRVTKINFEWQKSTLMAYKCWRLAILTRFNKWSSKQDTSRASSAFEVNENSCSE
jgi:hypothetical protein